MSVKDYPFICQLQRTVLIVILSAILSKETASVCTRLMERLTPNTADLVHDDHEEGGENVIGANRKSFDGNFKESRRKSTKYMLILDPGNLKVWIKNV